MMMMEGSIDATAARAGALRYRRLLSLATIMSIITILATIAALSVNWFAYVQTYKAVEQQQNGLTYVLNRTLTFWDLHQSTVTFQIPTASWTTYVPTNGFSHVAQISGAAQGFDLIALFGNAAVLFFLLLSYSTALRTRMADQFGARTMRLVPGLVVFGVGVCLLVAALTYVGINRALDLDGSSCQCYASFAQKTQTNVGINAIENPYSNTMQPVDIIIEGDWGPQAGWFLTLLQIPFIFVLLYSVLFNRPPLPVDHFALAEPL